MAELTNDEILVNAALRALTARYSETNTLTHKDTHTPTHTNIKIRTNTCQTHTFVRHAQVDACTKARMASPRMYTGSYTQALI